jgi:DNA-binding response OmpR family regulator
MKDGKFVVLYVDDDRDMLETIDTVLTAAGYQVVLATNGEDGLRKYKESKPDFVIIDLMMEEVDAGTHMARELLALRNTAPVYMLSSVGDALSVQTNAAELGLDGVFQKPVDFNALKKTIQAKLGR